MRRQYATTSLALMFLALGVGADDDVEQPLDVCPTSESRSACRGDAATGVTDRATDELIQQLGSTTFEAREAATSELSRRGNAIEPQLKTALRDVDLEIRLRARELLAGMSHADLRRRIAAFVNDVEGTQQHNLPAWKEYQSSFGDDRPKRRLFAEMVTGESDLLTAYVSDKEKAAALLSGRILAFENGLIPGLDYQVPTASIAALLFLASDEKVPIPTSLGFQVYRFLNLSAARKAIEDESHTPLVKQLLVSWLRRSMSNTSLARSGLLLAERYELNDTALLLATQMLADKDMPGYSMPYALLTIGRFGNAENITTVRSLLANATVCHTWHNGNFEKPIEIQVRDVALAVLVHLTKQDHKQYGFDLLRPDGNGFFYVFTLGFPDDKQRDAALAKWQSWSESSGGS